ncbi:hypothetical protein [Corynebacterium hylobatis]|uniref:hypothetical protein n=1 Tax=Corynebacterium hylobatis TaxID=1859290 RepID=UPI001F4A0374|nr:hypothetical protein [Corynebacterium hylobatis]
MSTVGKEAGFDCVAFEDCSVLFTVEAIEPLDSCPGIAFDEQPADTILVHIPVLIKTKPSDFEYDPGYFTIRSEWSALTEDGLNHPLGSSTWCSNPADETPWISQIHVGDTVRHVHYADVPIGTTEIRLTEDQTSGRWTFPAPDLQTTSHVSEVPAAPAAPEVAPAAAPTPAAPPTPAPAPAVPAVPAPSPAPAPVIGFTGAPGHDQPRVLDKTIASCGDPMMHETGTTFFTDGTSGWTQDCANQMGY